MAAQQYKLQGGKKDVTFADFFPIKVVEEEEGGRDSNERIIAMFKQYNLSRGYTEDGRKPG